MRFHWSHWCYAVAMVLFVGLAILPTTGWILKRHLLFVQQGFTREPLDILDISDTSSLSKDINGEAVLLRLQRPGLAKIRSLSNKHPNDPFVQSLAAKTALHKWSLRSDEDYTPKRRDLQIGQLLLIISKRGLAIDSRRTDFLLARSCGLMASGNRDEARTTLIAASKTDRYSDDSEAAGQMVRRWYRHRHYLGAQFEPDLANYDATIRALSDMAAYWCKKGTRRERLETATAVLAMTDQISRQTRNPYIFQQLRNAIRNAGYAAVPYAKDPNRFRIDRYQAVEDAVKPPSPPTEPIIRVSNDDAIILELVDTVESRAKNLGVLPQSTNLATPAKRCLERAAEYEQLKDRAILATSDPEDQFLASIGILLSAMAVPLVGLAMRLGQFRWRRMETELGMLLLLPMAIAIATIFTRRLEDYWAAVLLAPMVLTIPACFLTKSRKVAASLMWTTIGLGLLQGGFELLNEEGILPWPSLAPSMSSGWIISLCLLIPWAMTSILRPRWLVWTLSATLMIVLAGCLGSGVANQLRWEMTGFTNFTSDIILLACTIGMAPRPQVKLSRIAGPVFLLGIVLYVGSAMREWSADRIWMQYQDHLESMARERTK